MCGRAYETYTTEELELRYESKHGKIIWPDYPEKALPNYNMAPSQNSWIVKCTADENVEIGFYRWGLVPQWAESVKAADQYSMINAKAEEITEKRSYKDAFIKRRCIIPVTGFYEWKRLDAKTKMPFAIHLKNEKIMSLAGVYEHWTSKETGEIVNSFSIITTAANHLMSSIHHRMPVIIPKGGEMEWLDSKIQDPAKLKKFLSPYPDNEMEAYEVSKAVNSPRNNSEALLNPVAPN